MPESVPVRCPACRRECLYTAPCYPCACGTPIAPRLDHHAAPTAVAHRAWEEEWITVRCPSCGRHDQWPRPELGCACGAVLRIPVTAAAEGAAGEAGAGAAETATTPGAAGTGAEDAGTECVEARETGETGPPTEDAEAAPADTGPCPDTPPPSRVPFRPIAIRTARDAVTATALYLRWLGHQDIRRADQRPTSGIGLAARGLLAHVDPSVHPASLRDVECLWLTAMTDSADCVYFSLAGYTADARARADSLAVPLFVLDLTGTPQPVNAAAERLDAPGA
ncbi:hypothetical protein NFX46_10515 [Streptomyces phaeoluteigriseus]|uniref:Restriction endonuclease type IV Mrr domain-containing protein n=1 Tax=Streptomyces phaeoluteigriseus TaxID=114686 RepID=A0ABY4Z554_9ACTN|nr:hypothetical protein [Streptomyces phaeoluteigriseus]USQ84189.1 hypothetical protein NFX46_10515 [Streptomyces phaeoluteigriseus]